MKIIEISAKEVVEYLENYMDLYGQMTVEEFVETMKEMLEEEEEFVEMMKERLE